MDARRSTSQPRRQRVLIYAQRKPQKKLFFTLGVSIIPSRTKRHGGLRHPETQHSAGLVGVVSPGLGSLVTSDTTELRLCFRRQLWDGQALEETINIGLDRRAGRNHS